MPGVCHDLPIKQLDDAVQEIGVALQILGYKNHSHMSCLKKDAKDHGAQFPSTKSPKNHGEQPQTKFSQTNFGSKK